MTSTMYIHHGGADAHYAFLRCRSRFCSLANWPSGSHHTLLLPYRQVRVLCGNAVDRTCTTLSNVTTDLWPTLSCSEHHSRERNSLSSKFSLILFRRTIVAMRYYNNKGKTSVTYLEISLPLTPTLRDSRIWRHRVLVNETFNFKLCRKSGF